MGQEFPTTRVTLLDRLKADEATAWSDFLDIYGPIVLRWCKRWTPHSNDEQMAFDLSQEVLIRLFPRARALNYDSEKGKFRCWLKMVADQSCASYLKAKRSSTDSQAIEVIDGLMSEDAQRDYIESIAGEHLWEDFQIALPRVRERITTNGNIGTYDAYVLTLPLEAGGDGQTDQDAAIKLSCTVDDIQKRRSLIRRMLFEEMTKLDEAGSN